MSASVREYAILYVGARRLDSAGVIGGGNSVLATEQHALDGPEHTGQLPIERLSTDDVDMTHVLAPDGLGGVTTVSAAAGAMVPTYLGPAEVFAVPDNRQALFSLPIVLDVGAGISIGTNAALVEVH